MISGGCLCGAIRYEIAARPAELINCHCSMCRRAHGAAFATFAPVPLASFNITSGRDRLVRYRSSNSVRRCFCGACGSPIVFLYDSLPDDAFVVAGSFDGDPGARLTQHIFVGSKAPWHEILDGLPRHDGDLPE